MKYKERDEFILHSENGKDYKLCIININNCRPPDMIYALDVWDEDGTPFIDEVFVGKEVLDKCERIDKENSDADSN